MWGFIALANGRHPDRHFDNVPFGTRKGDDVRLKLAGKTFSQSDQVIKGACLLLKGDLKELSST